MVQTGTKILNQARGIDERCIKMASNVDLDCGNVLDDVDRKSVSAEVNYGIRFSEVIIVFVFFVRFIHTFMVQNGTP